MINCIIAYFMYEKIRYEFNIHRLLKSVYFIDLVQSRRHILNLILSIFERGKLGGAEVNLMHSS